jgi:poly(A) polymerase
MNSREFAILVVQQLTDAGYQALWAGGCVRDQLLELPPKDYDVATNATPDQIREVFGKRRTLPIGAAFGVITVLGPKQADPIEVATFRRDTGYSDGRHPDGVEFTDAKEDALRRDFTINGMFYDPLAERVVDYVGGKDDLAAKRIRAIGVPQERIEEDKLRMLRGVRFAAKFGFEIEAETLAAIHQQASQLPIVSGERIGAEMQRMLADKNRSTAVQLLRDSNLLSQVVPESHRLTSSETIWQELLDQLARLRTNDFPAAAAILLRSIIEADGISAVAQQWKLSNDQRKTIAWSIKHRHLFSNAHNLPWSAIQPLLISPHIESALAYAAATCAPKHQSGIEFCHQRLAWQTEKLNPPPLIDGQDLISTGIKPGPDFKNYLQQIRNQQLDGKLHNRTEALAWVANQTATGP